MKNIVFFCIAISICLFVACKGDQGDAGAAGSIGPAGPAGPGSVKAQTFTIAAAGWSFSAPSWNGSMSYPAITQAIENQGGVFVYWKNPGGNWVALPFTYYPTDWHSSTLQAEHYVGGVKILKTDSDLTQPVNPGDMMFKVLAVSGEGMVRNPNLNWNNFVEVGEHFDFMAGHG